MERSREGGGSGFDLETEDDLGGIGGDRGGDRSDGGGRRGRRRGDNVGRDRADLCEGGDCEGGKVVSGMAVSVYRLKCKRKYRVIDRRPEEILARHPARPVEMSDEQRRAGYMARVVRVVDGDTVIVNDGDQDRTVRMAGIDAPELGEPAGRGQAAAWGATVFLRDLAMGELVEVVWGGECDRVDVYGREVAWLVRVPDGLNLCAEMVRGGHARAWGDFEKTLAFELHELEVRARVAKRGMWTRHVERRE